MNICFQTERRECLNLRISVLFVLPGVVYRSAYQPYLTFFERDYFLINMTEEQIIKRKLLFDGEGTGEDRRINFFQKMVVKWVLTDYDSQEENANMYNKILLQLSHMEHSRRKGELIKLSKRRELQQYKDYQNKIKHNIACIQEAINTSKIILAKVKCEKHQRLNYDMIIKEIVEQPSRIETAQTVQQLQLNIDDMKKAQQILKNEFLIWRKHFVVLLTSANQMCIQLNEFKSIKDDSNDI